MLKSMTIRAFDQPERTRMSLIDKLKVMVDFQELDCNGKRVLVFEVAGRPLGLPVQSDGVAWWYEGDSLIPLPEEMRRKIYAESGFDFSGSICPYADIDDLDVSAIEIFRQKWAEKSGNHRLLSLSIEQLLCDCEAITDDGITYAALSLFEKKESLGKYLPQAEMNCEMKDVFTVLEGQARQGGMRRRTSERGVNLTRTCTKLTLVKPKK